jgi:hypothetical protein
LAVALENSWKGVFFWAGMKTYACVCGQLIFFENVVCVNCAREIGFLPETLTLSSLEPAGERVFQPTAPEAGGRLYKKCLNYEQQAVCNWMVPADSNEAFCTSCRLDEIIPDLSVAENQVFWVLIENAKRRLVYSLLSLKLPILNKADDPATGLSFRFLAEPPGSKVRVLTGHDEGIITLNIAEADDSHREKMRISMKEPYRTLLGHFRHEIGHYYWDRLVAGTKYLEPFRALFGDETADYNQALVKYYASGAPLDWQLHYVSVYSTAHPWEDWAETWAHYLHIQDTLEVALDFELIDEDLSLEPKQEMNTSGPEPRHRKFEEVIGTWARLSVALNSLNRSMGLHDLYPFVLSSPVVEKLRFVAEVIAGGEII